MLGSEPTEKAVVHTAVPGLDLLPSDIDLVGAEVELVTIERREHRLATALSAVAASYQYVLID